MLPRRLHFVSDATAGPALLLELGGCDAVVVDPAGTVEAVFWNSTVEEYVVWPQEFTVEDAPGPPTVGERAAKPTATGSNLYTLYTFFKNAQPSSHSPPRLSSDTIDPTHRFLDMGISRSTGLIE